jgi:hypothetical protein
MITPSWPVEGDLVDYSSTIGRAPTMLGAVVRVAPRQLPSGEWVVWLHGKSGCVSLRALSKPRVGKTGDER